MSDAPYFAMFTPEGNAAVARLVEQTVLSDGDGYRVLRDAVAQEHPEVTDTHVRDHIVGALLKAMPGKSLDEVAAIIGCVVFRDGDYEAVLPATSDEEFDAFLKSLA